MREKWIPNNQDEYAEYLCNLRQIRKNIKALEKQTKSKRYRLSKHQRNEILSKTAAKCHICGGSIEGYWEADHVLSHSKGGLHSIDNYLPAHRTCNNYRWDYTSEEFQEIMKLGIWLRSQIENKTTIGMAVADKFIKHETRRISRRKSK